MGPAELGGYPSYRLGYRGARRSLLTDLRHHLSLPEEGHFGYLSQPLSRCPEPSVVVQHLQALG